jgi:hypothetical protein
MSDRKIALDFVDIALAEIENRNIASAREFIEDAMELIENEDDLTEVHTELQNALYAIDDGHYDGAYDHVRFSWLELAED